ncbi:hypothetical protein ACLBSW_26175, partial [Pseudomonas aeruginosa]|uniref:hypothetical protein n=1 Tax=Pseudomonas aeruginosa TaxID=287 RepID=UPI00396969AC
MHGEIDEDRTNIVDSQRQLSIELARLYFFASIGKTRYPTKVFYIFCKNCPNGQEGKKNAAYHMRRKDRVPRLTLPEYPGEAMARLAPCARSGVAAGP